MELKKIEFIAEELIEDLYEEVEKLIFKEECENAEPLPKPKSAFDVIFESAI